MQDMKMSRMGAQPVVIGCNVPHLCCVVVFAEVGKKQIEIYISIFLHPLSSS